MAEVDRIGEVRLEGGGGGVWRGPDGVVQHEGGGGAVGA
jgi:hypothetical protein